MSGTVGILNVGAGDIELSFNPENPTSGGLTANAGRSGYGRSASASRSTRLASFITWITACGLSVARMHGRWKQSFVRWPLFRVSSRRGSFGCT